ncbi:hypothetical protein GUJ93_ZPchr0001g30014 [Zizania palustris]|uniref:Uncharacterized protein n=1 Tax=Zizania palustris TaxID=103762 RepID=A0A8J5RQ60_ZIZPA|nr:hypothetical protein GUJ93_ZPchr0001g30014 [Zizania palustris]
MPFSSNSYPQPVVLLSNGRSAAAEEEGGNVAELAGSQKGQQDGSDCTEYGEVAGDDRSSGDCGGQYVIRYVKDGEMERVLERQAELIGQYEAEEEAQRQWEKRFNENRTSTKVGSGQGAQCIEELKSSVRNLSSTSNNRSAADRLFSRSSLPESPQNASRQQHVAAVKRNAHEEHHGSCPAQSQESSSGVGAMMARQNRDQGDENPDMKAPSDGSPSTSDATLNSKVSDWSLSRFHSHGDNNQLGTSPDQQPGSNMDVESVLQALQLARISLRQKLNKPVPPSQVTLALPAPGDDAHTEEDGYSAVDDEFNSARDEPCCSSSPSPQEILALPAPEDYHEREDLPGNDANTSLTQEPVSSSPHRQEILALPAPGDDFYSMTENEIKIPIGAAGLFRLPTDSFPKDEMLSRCSSTYGSVLGLRPTATTLQNDLASNTAASRVTVAPSMLRDDPSFSAKQCYDPRSSMLLLSVPASGRCSGTTSSDFTVGGASVLSGIPGLAEDFMMRADADLFMQLGCDYTISNKSML